MKILAIRGRNLASLEGDFEIDFTVEPLQSAGIFAITGNTGSGKSTILDAICLALFNATPRTKQAPKREKGGNEDDTLIGSDVRNILRRGTGEGFAEVDFIALDGEKYRATWYVQRARKNPQGKLQSETQRLINLATHTEESLSKRDFPHRIQQLIGLTFNQFTRAVLLAQGDFSTFLKAGEDEKAELLEKLTGTDIYSKISIEINNQYKESKEEYDRINQQMAHIDLLSEEEIATLNLRKETLNKELQQLKRNIFSVDQQLNWLNTKIKYTELIEKAEKELEAIDLHIQQTVKRKEYLTYIEASLEIRNEYLDYKSKKEQKEKYTLRLSELNEILKTNGGKLLNCDQYLKSIKKELENIDKQLIELNPLLEKISALEIQITSEKKAFVQAKAEFEREEEKRKTSEQRVRDFESLLQKENNAIQLITQWFQKKDSYKEIIPKSDVIINTLNEIESYHQNKVINRNQKEMLNKKLELLKEELLQKELQAKKLEDILPAEIITLRKKLIHGEACPICGSTEHPYLHKNISSSAYSIFNEESLEKQKKIMETEIDRIKSTISQSEREIIQKETLIHNFEKQSHVALKKIESLIDFLPEWEIRTLNHSLQKEISAIAEKWESNLLLLNTKTNLKESVSLNLENEQKNLKLIESESTRKKEICELHKQNISELNNTINELAKGKNIREIEKKLKTEKESHSVQFEEVKKTKDLLSGEKSKIEGTIHQINEEVQSLETKIKALEKQISDWLNKSTHSINAQKLEELSSISFDRINTERNFFNGLNAQKIKAMTSLKERKQQLQDHYLSSYKPLEEMTHEKLTTLKDESIDKESDLTEKLTEIQVLLTKYKQDQETIRKYQKELDEKQEKLENWQKLNYLLGSYDGSRFKRIAQGYTLDVLLGYANKHLEKLSKRYYLKKVPYSLALQVVDKDIFEEVRTVHYLSGGESFLISLALALGLSSLSSNRINIESLFIDEGFGSLDVDTLSIAMEALENLQTQGRKIGVISHVAEMTERIPVQIQLVKLNNGKSRIQIKK